MAFNFYMPDIGEGVVEGEIVSWKVKEGDRVKLDQPLVEVMTDKATVELPSPRAGTIVKIHYQDGQICPVGQILVSIDEEAGAAASPGNGQPGHAAGPAAPAAPPPTGPPAGPPAAPPPPPPPPGPPAGPPAPSSPRPRSMPHTASPPPFPSGPTPGSSTTPPP